MLNKAFNKCVHGFVVHCNCCGVYVSKFNCDNVEFSQSVYNAIIFEERERDEWQNRIDEWNAESNEEIYVIINAKKNYNIVLDEFVNH